MPRCLRGIYRIVLELLVCVVKISFCKRSELLYATVAEKWPPLAHGLASFEANLNNLALLSLAEIGNELTLWACNKTVSPELYTIGHSRWVGLVSATVHRNHRQTVCNSMTALHCLPSAKLA